MGTEQRTNRRFVHVRSSARSSRLRWARDHVLLVAQVAYCLLAEQLVGGARELVRVVLGTGALFGEQAGAALANQVGGHDRHSAPAGELARQHRLATRRGIADDDRQRPPGAPAQPLGERPERIGPLVLPGALIAGPRRRADQRDLRADERPMRRVEGPQRGASRAAASASVCPDERARGRFLAAGAGDSAGCPVADAGTVSRSLSGETVRARARRRPARGIVCAAASALRGDPAGHDR
jgi:hypothetical protein